jgi:alcohol dehydrogenase
VSKRFGASYTVNSQCTNAVDLIMKLTQGIGVDVAMEAVGIPDTFDICQQIVAPGGHVANIGVHGKPVSLRLEKLWDRNVTITTRLVDTFTTPMLLKAVASGAIDPGKIVTHRFQLNEMLKAYDTFGHAAREHALKVVLHDEQ